MLIEKLVHLKNSLKLLSNKPTLGLQYANANEWSRIARGFIQRNRWIMFREFADHFAVEGQECTFSAGVGLRPVRSREGCCAALHITPWSAIAPLSAPLLLD